MRLHKSDEFITSLHGRLGYREKQSENETNDPVL